MKKFSLLTGFGFVLLHIGTTYPLFNPDAERKKWIYAEDILIEHPRKAVTPFTKSLLGATGIGLGYGVFEASKFFIGDNHSLTNAVCLLAGIGVGLKTYSSIKGYILHKKELQQIAILMKEWHEAHEVRNGMPRPIRDPLNNLHETYLRHHSNYDGQAELTLSEIKAKIADHNNPFKGFFWRLLLRAFGR